MTATLRETVNGSAAQHPLAPPALPPRVSPPVSQWPRQEAALREPPRERRGWRDARQELDGDTVIRLVAACAVLGVAVIAAVVSYSHIFDLARQHHESGTAARLLPVSVDGLIASASLALLHAARKRVNAPGIAYLMLSLGVGATIAANVEFGLPFGWLSAVIAAWPAIAFVGSVEMALTLVRTERQAADGGTESRLRWWQRWRERRAAGKRGDDGATMAVSAVTEAAAPPGRQAPAAVRKAATRARRTARPADRVDAELAANPGRTNAEIAKAAGVSERTVERRREAARKADAQKASQQP